MIWIFLKLNLIYHINIILLEEQLLNCYLVELYWNEDLNSLYKLKINLIFDILDDLHKDIDGDVEPLLFCLSMSDLFLLSNIYNLVLICIKM